MGKPVLILIRDGWGFRRETTDNAVAQGDTARTDELMEHFPNMLINASGKAVGLPEGYQGNSEVGHMTIGSGRIIDESLVKINRAIEDGSIKQNKAFLAAIDNCKKNNSTMHIIGLLQEEGVHAHYTHLYALLELCKDYELQKVCVHVITDGRDAPPTAGKEKIHQLQMRLNLLGVGAIATISGRYYAMDRDKRWERTQKAYDTIVEGKGDEIIPLENCYEHDETDEFLIPRKAEWYQGMCEGDSVMFFNFRSDRPRQLTKAIIDDTFEGFDRHKINVCFVAMTSYYKPMDCLVAFDDEKIPKILGEILSEHGLKQLRISETEKYAHVTFFFNAQNEVPFPNEDRILIPSPKVATYDLMPQMSAYEITNRVLKEIDRDYYDVVMMNIVNGDMVGHTGVIPACLRAVQVVDECVNKIVKKILEKDGTALVFADHGNIEDQTPKWRTSHTINPVPFIVVSNRKHTLQVTGGLQDVAPTVLHLLGIEQPKEMTGRSLIIN